MTIYAKVRSALALFACVMVTVLTPAMRETEAKIVPDPCSAAALAVLGNRMTCAFSLMLGFWLLSIVVVDALGVNVISPEAFDLPAAS